MGQNNSAPEATVPPPAPSSPPASPGQTVPPFPTPTMTPEAPPTQTETPTPVADDSGPGTFEDLHKKSKGNCVSWNDIQTRGICEVIRTVKNVSVVHVGSYIKAKWPYVVTRLNAL